MAENARYLVLYDGVCGLCHRVVRFVLPRDARGAFVFAPLQSDEAREVLARHGRGADMDTFVLVEDPGGDGERVSDRFRGAVRLLRGLGGAWGLIGLLLSPVPNGLGDFVYAQVARRRYRWFGEADACLLPPPEQRGRFVGLPSGGAGSDERGARA